jgi:hypothetical protein
MKTIAAAALSLVVAVSLTPVPSLAQSMSAGGSHNVFALLDDQDVQRARGNQDLQAPRENQDVQAPRENQDVQAPRENQDVQAPRTETMPRGASSRAPVAMSPASAVSR